MLQTTIQNLLDQLRDRDVDPIGYRLYVVKNGTDVLYVGQSSHIRARIRWHTRSTLPLGQALAANHPQSQQWEVSLYTVEECADLIQRYFPYAPRVSNYSYDTSTRNMEDFAEDALIHDLAPRYNQRTNVFRFGSSPTPFTQRTPHSDLQSWQNALRAAKEESERRDEQKRKERQAFLLKSVCTICGAHDTWRARDGEPCGVVDSTIVRVGDQYIHIPLVCHSCNDIINTLSALEKDPERVRKVKDAIERRKADELAALYGIE